MPFRRRISRPASSGTPPAYRRYLQEITARRGRFRRSCDLRQKLDSSHRADAGYLRMEQVSCLAGVWRGCVWRARWRSRQTRVEQRSLRQEHRLERREHQRFARSTSLRAESLQVTEGGGLPAVARSVGGPPTPRLRWATSACNHERRLERETGIEPATSSLGSSRSTAELLPQRV